MSRNPSNTSDLTRGAGGHWGPTNPSAYPQRVSPGDLQPDPASNTSHQQGNNNQGDNSASRSGYVPFPRTSGNPSSSNSLPGSQLEAFQRQPQGQEPFNNLAGSYQNPRGGSQAQGSTAGTGQGGAQAGGYGGGNQNGGASSTSANRGSSNSGR